MKTQYVNKIKSLDINQIFDLNEKILKEAEELWKKEFKSLNRKDVGFPSTRSYIKSTVGAISVDVDGNSSKYRSAKKVINWLESQGLYAEYIEQ
jgi:hypothetical protein